MSRLLEYLGSVTVTQYVVVGAIVLISTTSMTFFPFLIPEQEQIETSTSTPTPTSVFEEVTPNNISSDEFSILEQNEPEETATPTNTPTPVPTPLPTPTPTETPPSPTLTPIPTEVTLTNTPTPSTTPTPIDVAPVLKNLMVTFSPYDSGTDKAGSFLFTMDRDRIFLEYGVTVRGSGGSPKILPTFEYIVEKNVPVYAVADGVIGSVTLNDNVADYEIFAYPNENSSWQIWYDHILNVTVQAGDVVTAGQQLGVAGIWDDTHSRTELMVRKWDSETQTAKTVCPFTVFDSSLSSQYQSKVSQFMTEWENYKNDDQIYDETNHPYPGCIYTEIAE